MPADIALFSAIARHGPLPSHYLYEFTRHVRRDRSHLQNRLTEFYNGDARGPYLTRPPQQFASYHARYQHLVYDLAPRGRQALSEINPTDFHTRSDPFVHRLMTACACASLELGATASGLRYIGWREILGRCKLPEDRSTAHSLTIAVPGDGVRLTPDDLFGIEYPGHGFRFFALEIDRNTESIERRNLAQSSFGAKVRSYDRIIETQAHRDVWGIPNLSVLTVTTSVTHAAAILRHIARASRYAGRYAVTTIPMFGAHWRVPPALLHTLLSEPWMTPSGARMIGQP